MAVQQRKRPSFMVSASAEPAVPNRIRVSFVPRGIQHERGANVKRGVPASTHTYVR